MIFCKDFFPISPTAGLMNLLEDFSKTTLSPTETIHLHLVFKQAGAELGQAQVYLVHYISNILLGIFDFLYSVWLGWFGFFGSIDLV